MSGISDVNPFVGPRPIHQGESLFGRDTEVRELCELLQARRVVVLHSPSGAGKSSLLQAGLIPRLRADKFDVWKPIRVNLDPADFDGLPSDTNRYLLSALISLEDELPAEHRRSPAQLAKLDFLEYLETRPRRKNRQHHSLMLLFDQFEEILSVAPRATAAKEAFFATVGRALDTQKYWALFAIREDYLAALAPYRDLVPTQLANTFRMDLLGLGGAREAAEKLAKQGGRSFPAVDRLIRDLSAVQVQQADGTFTTEQGLHIEPVYLQVVCRRLWDAMPTDDLSIDEVDVETYAGITKSLASYYSDSMTAIAGDDVALERSIRDWIGTKLIVGGIRSPIRQGAGTSAGLDNRHVAKLLDSYLVRTEQRAGANWYELSHDRLVEPIQRDNDAWRRDHLHPLQVQAKLWEDGGRARSLLLGAEMLQLAQEWAAKNPELLTASEREFLALSRALSDEQASARRRRRAFTASLAAVAVVAVVVGGIAWWQALEAKSQRQEAENQREAAEIQRQEAERLREEAETQRQEAWVARDAAKAAQAEAVDARTRAEKAQKENERSVRQAFEVSLQRLVGVLARKNVRMGEFELDDRWTALLQPNGQTVIAATVGKDFRIVVAGHDSVLSEVDERGSSLFLAITATWLFADQARREVAIITQQPDSSPDLKRLAHNLTVLGYTYTIDPSLEHLQGLENVGVLIIDSPSTPFTAQEVATVGAFIQRGGGVLAAGAGWQWLEGQPADGQVKPTLDDYPLNLLLASHGVQWTQDAVDPPLLDQRDVPATARFENKSGGAIALYTRRSSGKVEEHYTTLARGEVLEILTSLQRQWIFRATADNRLIGTAVIKAHEQTIVIKARVEVTSKDKTPELPPPRATILDKIADVDLQPTLTKAKTAAKECGDKFQTIWPSVRVQFTVAANGKVMRTSVLEPMKGTQEGSCVASALEDLTFPKTRKGGDLTWNLRL